MTRLLPILLTCLTLHAEDIYISQTAAGSGDGSSCANAKAVTFFNNGANWGAGVGQINAGDVVHLCGAVTSSVTFHGSGTAGNYITFLFENGASLTQPASSLMNLGGNNYLVIDGGVNGIIENTANGTGLANTNATSGIIASGSHDVLVANLAVKNLFVKTGTAFVTGVDFTTAGAVYANPIGPSVRMSNCFVTNVCWVFVAFGGSNGITGFQFTRNILGNYDHGLAGLSGITNGLVTQNHFGSMAVWDTATGDYHHDGIHAFSLPGLKTTLNISSNIFDGDPGVNNTAWIYAEGDGTTNGLPNWSEINNLFLIPSGRIMNNGSFNINGYGWTVANNTILSASVTANSIGIGIAYNPQFKNNIISGVTTFLYGPLPTYLGTSDYNLFANRIAGGNAPYIVGGTNYATLAAWQAKGQDTHSSQVASADLTVVGVPNSTSPAIGAALDLSSIFQTDLNGATRTVPWTIGAYNAAGTTTTNPPIVITGKVALRGAIHLRVGQ